MGTPAPGSGLSAGGVAPRRHHAARPPAGDGPCGDGRPRVRARHAVGSHAGDTGRVSFDLGAVAAQTARILEGSQEEVLEAVMPRAGAHAHGERLAPRAVPGRGTVAGLWWNGHQHTHVTVRRGRATGGIRTSAGGFSAIPPRAGPAVRRGTATCEKLRFQCREDAFTAVWPTLRGLRFSGAARGSAAWAYYAGDDDVAQLAKVVFE